VSLVDGNGDPLLSWPTDRAMQGEASNARNWSTYHSAEDC